RFALGIPERRVHVRSRPQPQPRRQPLYRQSAPAGPAPAKPGGAPGAIGSVHPARSAAPDRAGDLAAASGSTCVGTRRLPAAAGLPATAAAGLSAATTAGL